MLESRSEQRKNIPPEAEQKQESTSEEKLSRREFILGSLALATLGGKTEEAAARMKNEVNKTKEGPKIEIEIFYGPHITGKDAEGLAEKIKECDVFIPEMFGENKRTLDLLSDFSEGKISPRDYYKKHGIDLGEIEEGSEPFLVALVNAIYNTHKLITLLDVPSGHPTYGRHEYLRELEFNFSMPFEKLVALHRRQGYEFANLQKDREQLILRRLLHFKKELARGAIPELRGKDSVKILLFLGAAHTGIYHELKKRGEAASRQFSHLPYTMSEEVTRRLLFDKEVSDDLIAKEFLGMLLDKMLEKYMLGISFDTSLKIKFTKKLTKLFSFEEIKNVFDKMRGKGGLTESIAPELFSAIAQKGITFPKSEEEMKKAVRHDYKWGVKK